MNSYPLCWSKKSIKDKNISLIPCISNHSFTGLSENIYAHYILSLVLLINPGVELEKIRYKIFIWEFTDRDTNEIDLYFDSITDPKNLQSPIDFIINPNLSFSLEGKDINEFYYEVLNKIPLDFKMISNNDNDEIYIKNLIEKIK